MVRMIHLQYAQTLTQLTNVCMMLRESSQRDILTGPNMKLIYNIFLLQEFDK
jgi:hypothetical protein